MSLFIGNISHNVRTRDLEDEFDKFGNCHVKHKGSYAFIEYDDERDGEDAVAELQNKNMGGLRINIEWSKRSGRYDPKQSRRPPRSREDIKCFACGKYGHFARECQNRRQYVEGSPRGRSSRSPSYGRQRGPPIDRDRSASHSKERDGRYDRERHHHSGGRDHSFRRNRRSPSPHNKSRYGNRYGRRMEERSVSHSRSRSRSLDKHRERANETEERSHSPVYKIDEREESVERKVDLVRESSPRSPHSQISHESSHHHSQHSSPKHRSRSASRSMHSSRSHSPSNIQRVGDMLQEDDRKINENLQEGDTLHGETKQNLHHDGEEQKSEKGEEIEWNDLKVVDLKEELKRRGLDTNGKKAVLVHRLTQHQQKQCFGWKIDSTYRSIYSLTLTYTIHTFYI